MKTEIVAAVVLTSITLFSINGCEQQQERQHREIKHIAQVWAVPEDNVIYAASTCGIDTDMNNTYYLVKVPTHDGKYKIDGACINEKLNVIPL